MAVSREYALNRLDRWYADQIRRNYTPEVAFQFKQKISERLDEAGILEEYLEMVDVSGTDPFSPEMLSESMGRFFSTAWNAFEGYIGDEALYFLTLPEDVRNEYVEPFLESFRTLRGIVNSVRAKANEVFPDELADDQVR